MKVIIRDTKKEASIWAAHHIAEAIKAKAERTDDPFVLGLPTGSTPLDTYAELARMCEAGEVSFKNVITFNMDEYVGIPEKHPESYHSFMYRNLFDKIDIPAGNIHILNGNAPDLAKECEDYEKAIVAAGGIDLFRLRACKMRTARGNQTVSDKQIGNALVSSVRINNITVFYQQFFSHQHLFSSLILLTK